MRCRARSLLAWLVIAVAAVTVTGLGLWLPNAASGQSAVLSIDAPPSVPPGGGQFPVTVSVQGVSNLGSYEWQILYDPDVIGFVRVDNGPFLGSTGRQVFCPGRILGEGTVRFGCATYQSALPGPSGSSVLSTVTFSPVAGGTVDIRFVCAGLTDASDEVISIPVSNVAECMAPFTPTPGPGDTPAPTSTPAPGEPTATPTPTGPLPTLTPVPPGLEAVDLVAGCNAVASTYPDGTPIGTIASNVGRTGILTSIWKFDLGTWLGYSPQFPEVSDLTETEFLDAVFICVNSPGAFVRPVV